MKVDTEIKMSIINWFTNEKELDGTINVKSDDKTNQDNWNAMRESYPNSNVVFFINDGGDMKSFLGYPLNMEKDQQKLSMGEMNLEDFLSKWYGPK